MSGSAYCIDVTRRVFVAKNSSYNDYAFQNSTEPDQTIGGEIILTHPITFQDSSIINVYNNATTDKTVYYLCDGRPGDVQIPVPILPQLKEQYVGGTGKCSQLPQYLNGQEFIYPQRQTWKLSQGINVPTFSGTAPSSNHAWTYVTTEMPPGENYPWWQFNFNSPQLITRGDVLTAGATDGFGNNELKDFKIEGSNNGRDFEVLYAKTDGVSIPQRTRFEFTMNPTIAYRIFRMTITAWRSNISLKALNYYVDGYSVVLKPGEFAQFVNASKYDENEILKYYWERLNIPSEINVIDESPIVLAYGKNNYSIGPITNYDVFNLIQTPTALNVATNPQVGTITISSKNPSYKPVMQATSYFKFTNNRSPGLLDLNASGTPNVYSILRGNITECGNADARTCGSNPLCTFQLVGTTQIDLEITDLLFMPRLYSNGVDTDPYYIQNNGIADPGVYVLTSKNIVDEWISVSQTPSFSYVTKFARQLSSMYVQNSGNPVTVTNITASTGGNAVALNLAPTVPFNMTAGQQVEFLVNTASPVDTIRFDFSTTSPNVKLYNVLPYVVSDPTGSIASGVIVINSI